MNNEEKARAYDAALERARKMLNMILDNELIGFPDQIREIFPVLKESEDERIRKFLVKHVSEWIGCLEHDLKISPKDVESEEELAMFKAGLAYLEKQKEQKPAEWSEEDEANFAWFDKFFRAESGIAGGKDIPQDKYLWFKSLHPQPKRDCKDCAMFLNGECTKPHWKPNEEDLMMLEHIIEQYEIGNKNSKVMGYFPRVKELDFLKKVFAIWKS